jgi:hypothetical protein
MPKAVILTKESQGHQLNWGSAFLQGIKRHGWEASIENSYTKSDLLVMWGVRRKDTIERAQKDGAEVCILERGYIGDRFKFSSVSFGGALNGRATFRGTRAEPDRFEKYFPGMMQPWRKEDGYALLIGQVPGDMSLDGCGGDLSRWYAETAAALGGEVRFRAHPQAGRMGPSRFVGKVIEGTLEDALSGASVCVTWNSNTAVESVLAGVPTVACDRGSMAWDVTSHSVKEPTVTPDRNNWAHRLAWCQWTKEELASGECWDAVKI